MDYYQNKKFWYDKIKFMEIQEEVKDIEAIKKRSLVGVFAFGIN